jgi:ssDNA-binding Zn-finger/Zn-ribbon topoisomerase 1
MSKQKHDRDQVIDEIDLIDFEQIREAGEPSGRLCPLCKGTLVILNVLHARFLVCHPCRKWCYYKRARELDADLDPPSKLYEVWGAHQDLLHRYEEDDLC